jgi:hypothetical protein
MITDTEPHIDEPAVDENDTGRLSPVFTEAERNAMRAYLARTEVRTSTLHRVLTAFVGGAGLMLLIPIFFKEVIDGIITVLLTHIDSVFPAGITSGDFVLGVVLYGLVVYPLLMSLTIPLYALYMLLKDIVHFYFTLYAPGFAEALQHPTFSLAALTFSSDESPAAKREIMRYQYASAERMRYMIPFSAARREAYFDDLLEVTKGDIIPVSRRLETLRAQGVLPENVDERMVEQFNTAMGITRALDRTLVEEVAYTEMAMVRNVLYVRRLVLRYVKALVMFIWTTLVSFIMLPFLQVARIPPFVTLCSGYLAWSLLAMSIMEMPINWMYRHRRGSADKNQVDAQLRHLEYRVGKFVYLAAVAAAVGLFISLIHLL